jgi:dTDP-4-dehydrorhamnose reductase
MITGASGLLGANLTLELVRQGHNVVALYGSHPIALTGASSAGCDLTDTAALSKLLSTWKPGLVIHCAAATNVDWCESHPREALRINADASGALAAHARSAGAEFVYISTDAVFDGVAGGYAENDTTAPANSYARSKLAGEEAVLRAMPEALVLRVNIYGWNLQPKSSLAEWVLTRLQQGEPVPGFRDTAFAPVLVNDLAGWILCLVNSSCQGVYHAASADHLSKFEFAREIAGVFQLDASLVRESLVEQSSLSAPRPRNTWLRASRMEAALGHGLPSIRQGLEKFRKLREDGFYERLKAAGVSA